MHGAYPNKLLKKRKIAGINLIPYIKIQINNPDASVGVLNPPHE